MVIVPDTNIILIKSPLKLDNYNQLTFSNATAQYNYFTSLTTLQINDATYQRKDDVIRFPTHTEIGDGYPTFEELLQYNYCMYQNNSFNSKWFYAFITNIKYINDGMTEITIETDSFQSWQFSLEYKNSFIEREHVSNDTIGAHTLPENVELGEYICTGQNKNDTLTTYEIIVASTVYLQSPYDNNGGGIYGGVYQGYRLYRFSNDSAGVLALQNKIMALNQADKLNAIVGIYLAPLKFFDSGIGQGDEVTQEYTLRGYTWGTGALTDSPITKPTTINGFSPKNNKLFTYPYCYLLMDNNNGGQAVYHFELFNDPISPNECVFDILGTPTFGGSFFVTPVNYKGQGDNYVERLCGGKLPTCGFQNDTYINWLTENGVNVITEFVTSGVSMTMGLASQNPLQATSGASGVANAINSINVASMQPAQFVGNAGTGDVNFASKNTTFTAYTMTIKSEYAQIIDNYFQMYGYKVNRLATPNIHKRSNWDFIKCVDVNLEGNIPEEDLNKIRSLFNNGCTFWHTTANYLDYSKPNSIL